MTWTAPSPPDLGDGPLVGPDRPILEGYLAWERNTLLLICAGLTAEQLAQRPVPPPNLSLLGLVRWHAREVPPVPPRSEWHRGHLGGMPGKRPRERRAGQRMA